MKGCGRGGWGFVELEQGVSTEGGTWKEWVRVLAGRPVKARERSC